jgi:hypothetical protein
MNIKCEQTYIFEIKVPIYFYSECFSLFPYKNCESKCFLNGTFVRISEKILRARPIFFKFVLSLEPKHQSSHVD